MLSKFKIWPLMAFGMLNILYADVSAATDLPLWHHALCQQALSMCVNHVRTKRDLPQRCKYFSKVEQPLFCAGSDTATGFKACKAALDETDLKKACYEGYLQCESNAFGAP